MAPRAHWKGFLKLSLVSCPIALYPAVSAAEKISFRQVSRETGNRLRQQLVDAYTGKVVERHNKGRGYEIGENNFLSIEDDELEAAKHEARGRPFSAAPARPQESEHVPTHERPAKRSALKLVAPEPHEAPPIVPAVVPRPIVENTRTIELDRFVQREQ